MLLWVEIELPRLRCAREKVYDLKSVENLSGAETRGGLGCLAAHKIKLDTDDEHDRNKQGKIKHELHKHLPSSL